MNPATKRSHGDDNGPLRTCNKNRWRSCTAQHEENHYEARIVSQHPPRTFKLSVKTHTITGLIAGGADLLRTNTNERGADVMSKRQKYRMTDEQYETIIKACKPVMCIALQCGMPRSPQENANNAWAALGNKLGFQPFTVESDGDDNKDFTAISTEEPTK